MNKSESLTIGYSTIGDRIKNIRFSDNFTNLVIIQNPNSLQVPQLKSEIKVIQLASKGVAKSRNTAIDNCQTEYLLFGDDDVNFKVEGINKVINFLNSQPDISIVMAQAVDEDGKLRKHYPANMHSLGLTNSAKAATYEMIVRISDIKKSGVRFDENFGAGAINYLGDEYIFIADCLRSGLKGKFIPVIIAQHPSDSSGNMTHTREDISARSKIFDRVFGLWAPVMRLLFLIKPPSKKFGLRNSLIFIFGK